MNIRFISWYTCSALHIFLRKGSKGGKNFHTHIIMIVLLNVCFKLWGAVFIAAITSTAPLTLISQAWPGEVIIVTYNMCKN